MIEFVEALLATGANVLREDGHRVLRIAFRYGVKDPGVRIADLIELRHIVSTTVNGEDADKEPGFVHHLKNAGIAAQAHEQ